MMQGLSRASTLVFLLFLVQAVSHATTLVVNPVDTGSIYVCNGCDPMPNRLYMTVGAYIRGEADFPTASFPADITRALLSVNPYSLPLGLTQLDVYGYASQNATISAADLNSPTFLGVWDLPSGLGYGDDAFYDVTNFLHSVNASYVDFILEGTGGADQFSSLQHNYSHASQLTLTIPEPASFTLALAGLVVLTLKRAKRGWSMWPCAGLSDGPTAG